MEYSNRTVQSPAAAPAAHSGAAGTPGIKKNKQDKDKWARIAVTLIGGAVLVLLVALVALISFGGDKPESEYVDGSKLQAVFLNTGQVYFGDIQKLNDEHIVLTNIYYLQTSNGANAEAAEAQANTNVSLVKLGCELHQPFDQMVINRDQVTFWENLHENGQVATAVSTFEKQNPNGQKCADQSSSAPTNSGDSAQPAGNSNSGESNTNTTNP